MHNSNAKKYAPALCVVLACLIAVCVFGCGQAQSSTSPEPGERTAELELAFIDRDPARSGQLIRYETRVCTFDSSRRTAQVAIDELWRGPSSGDLASPVPEGVELSDITVSGDTALVVLSRAGEVSDADMLRLRTCITMTLLGLDNISKVGVYVDEISYVDGEPEGLMSSEDVAVQMDKLPEE